MLNSSDRYLAAVQELEKLTTDLTESDIVQQGVDIAQVATESRIAYLHFLNEDQNTIELGVWSHDTIGYCNAVYARHYPIESAGIWADTARTRLPCIHNDYAAQSNKRGLPDGHSPLYRHLGVPVEDDGLVRLLIGVGNKVAEYEQDDVEILQMIARRIWSVTRQRRQLERYIDLGKRFVHVQEIASICALEYDLDEDSLVFDGMFSSIFRARHATERPNNLHEFLALVSPADHETVRAALTGTELARQSLRINCLRMTGEHFPAELKIEHRAREVGQGMIGIGILQDITELAMVEDLKQRADKDPLTGLPNRNRLQTFFLQGFGRRGSIDGFAFHYIDLDDFKPVNDQLGHPVGDEVLRMISQRLQQTVRKDDLVVRMGGDEFAIVQTGVDSPRAASALAKKIIGAVGAPIFVLGHTVSVGASVGITLCTGYQCPLQEISAAADRALYKAKAAGGRCHVLEP